MNSRLSPALPQLLTLLRIWYACSPRTLSLSSCFSQYSPSYYRAIWIAIGLDAGFATAMTVRPKWLRDICSVLFSIYYIIYATEAQEKVHPIMTEEASAHVFRTDPAVQGRPYCRNASNDLGESG
jgi:hypothetical protein